MSGWSTELSGWLLNPAPKPPGNWLGAFRESIWPSAAGGTGAFMLKTWWRKGGGWFNRHHEVSKLKSSLNLVWFWFHKVTTHLPAISSSWTETESVPLAPTGRVLRWHWCLQSGRAWKQERRQRKEHRWGQGSAQATETWRPGDGRRRTGEAGKLGFSDKWKTGDRFPLLISLLVSRASHVICAPVLRN